MITYGEYRKIKTTCRTCLRLIHARPVYGSGVNISGWEPMEYKCDCEKPDVYSVSRNYQKWLDAGKGEVIG